MKPGSALQLADFTASSGRRLLASPRVSVRPGFTPVASLCWPLTPSLWHHAASLFFSSSLFLFYFLSNPLFFWTLSSPPLRCRHLQPVNSGVSYVGRSSLETTASLFLCIATTTRWPHCTASPAPAPPHPGPEVMGSRCGAREAGKCTHTHTHA